MSVFGRLRNFFGGKSTKPKKKRATGYTRRTDYTLKEFFTAMELFITGESDGYSLPVGRRRLVDVGELLKIPASTLGTWSARAGWAKLRIMHKEQLAREAQQALDTENSAAVVEQRHAPSQAPDQRNGRMDLQLRT